MIKGSGQVNRENLFVGLSDKELIFYYNDYKKLLINKDDAYNNAFYSYVDVYIRMMQDESETFKYISESGRYHAAFARAERHLLNAIAKRFVKIGNLWSQITECFK